ncbi:hypothetical protein LEMLEM_LOCUS13117 [Lemmus lemmus]
MCHMGNGSCGLGGNVATALSLPPLLFSGARQQKSLTRLAPIRTSPYEKGIIGPQTSSLPHFPFFHQLPDVTMRAYSILGAPLRAQLGYGVFSTTDSITFPSALLKAISLFQVTAEGDYCFPNRSPWDPVD